MDLMSGGGPDVQLFWPFWSRDFRPFAGGLPLHSFTTHWGDLLGLLLDPWTVRGMLMEAVIFGPIYAATVVQRRTLRIVLGSLGAAAWILLALLANP